MRPATDSDIAIGPGDHHELVAAVRAGDRGAFTWLVERHTPELRTHCRRMLGSVDEAEDVVQETFLRAWRSRGGFEGRSKVRTWLYCIATNACLDTRRRRPKVTDGLPLDTAPSDAEAEATVEATSAIDPTFLAAIQRLPSRQRSVLVLRYGFGWPASDTATLLGTSVAAANSALQRARASLRAKSQHFADELSCQVREIEGAPPCDESSTRPT